MRKTRKCAWLLSMALLFSCLWESWAIAANAQEMKVETVVETIDLTPVDNQTVSGNTVKKESIEADVTPVVEDNNTASDSDALQTITERSQIYGQDVTFDKDSTWDDKGEYNIALTTTEALKSGARVTMDIVLPEAATFNGIIKVQGVARLGSGWEWKQAPTIAELTADSFETADSGYKKATVEFTFGDEITDDYLAQFTIKLAGYQCDYSGAVYVENINLYDGEAGGSASNTTPLKTIAERSQIYNEDVTFDKDSTWDDKGEHNIALTTEEALKSGARVTMDIVLPEAATFDGIIKVQGVARLGSGWDWKQAPAIAELTADSFEAADSGYKKATVEFTFGDEITEDYLAQFTIKLAGYQCDYSGPVYVENINLYDGASSGELNPTDDTVIDDFESYNVNENGNWVSEGGWQYEADMGIAVAEFNESKMLKLDVDYTGKAEVSWSEAKVGKTFETGYDVTNYNCLTLDFYYPAAFSGSVKLFSNGLIDKEAVVEVKEELSNGYKKAQAMVKFSPSTTAMSGLTIGIVGVNTEFNGSVYIDNIVLSQYSAAGEYVEITAVPGSGTVADISKAPSSVKLADKDATASASALYAYLCSLSSSNQVLFGHENDYNKAVSATASEGDVKEVTGSLSGMYGIDTLSLTGAELGITDPSQAIETAAANSIAAANQGAIITLSAHMPNFTNSKITKNADGTFNFTSCDFSESKDLSNDSAEQILPGGAYNAQYNAYLDIIADMLRDYRHRIFRLFSVRSMKITEAGSGGVPAQA